MRRAAVTLWIVLASILAGCRGGEAADEAYPPSVPYEGPGRLATVWSWGADRPDGSRALVVTSGGRSRRLSLGSVHRARWHGPEALVVERFLRPVREGSGSQILRVSAEGELLELLSDREGIADPEPHGNHVLVRRFDRRQFRGLELRSLVDRFRLEATHPRASAPALGSFSAPVWSPEGERFAVGLDFAGSAAEPGRVRSRLAIASRDVAGFEGIADEIAGGSFARWSVVPLFWSVEGIHVRSPRGLLRCDPSGSGCVALYDPGPQRSLLAGCPIQGGKALLLVRDLVTDFLEPRARELHEVDLATGTARVLLRLPEGVFLADLDWIGGP